MEEEGIVETSPATIVKRTQVDWNIETPILGSDTGDDLGTTVSRVSGVHRSKFVTKQGRIIKEYDDELDYQDLEPYKGSATEKVAKEKKAADRKSVLTRVVDWLRRDDAELHQKVSKVQEDAARRNVESKEVQLGEDPALLTQERLDKYNAQRKIDQEVADWAYKRDRK